MLYTTTDSPIGQLMLVGDERALRGLYMTPHPAPRADWRTAAEPFAAARDQLAEYFAGERHEFTVPLELEGTPFQQRVWEALRTIPYGETRSYGRIATQIGRPDRARAVGTANGSNPVSIVVPCHRVIGADGSLTGYGGGLERKRYLLDLESGVLSLTP
jgi:methylated-DNA-[protein]-cysteine S-methyltransferase